MKTRILKLFGASFAALAFVADANAIPYVLTPSSPAIATGATTNTGNSQPSTSNIEDYTGFSPLTIVYKKEVDGGGEAGTFAGSYHTTFFNTDGPGDQGPESAKIVYQSGPVISLDPLFLLVKDGNHNPYWYLFDISSWNGTDTIELNNFWNGGGCISNVVIYSGNHTSVPDGGLTALLLGAALMGVGMLANRSERSAVARAR